MWQKLVASCDVGLRVCDVNVSVACCTSLLWWLAPFLFSNFTHSLLCVYHQLRVIYLFLLLIHLITFFRFLWLAWYCTISVWLLRWSTHRMELQSIDYPLYTRFFFIKATNIYCPENWNCVCVELILHKMQTYPGSMSYNRYILSLGFF